MEVDTTRPQQEPEATPVTINPLLFYLGILLSVVGYAAERGGGPWAIHAGAGKSCTNRVFQKWRWRLL